MRSRRCPASPSSEKLWCIVMSPARRPVPLCFCFASLCFVYLPTCSINLYPLLTFHSRQLSAGQPDGDLRRMSVIPFEEEYLQSRRRKTMERPKARERLGLAQPTSEASDRWRDVHENERRKSWLEEQSDDRAKLQKPGLGSATRAASSRARTGAIYRSLCQI